VQATFKSCGDKIKKGGGLSLSYFDRGGISQRGFRLTIENNSAVKRDYRVINESRVYDLGSVANEGCDIVFGMRIFVQSYNDSLICPGFFRTCFFFNLPNRFVLSITPPNRGILRRGGAQPSH